jgi:type 1 glutamine amidotransferase
MRHVSRFPRIFLAVAGLALAAVSLSANETKPQLLFLGGSSGSHQTAAMADLLIPVLTDAGFQVKYTEDVAALRKENLDKLDAVIVFRDHGNLPADVENDFLSAIEQGKGLIAIHCASHCFRNSERYTRLIGGRFDTHQFGEFRTRILDAQHPAMVGLQGFDMPVVTSRTRGRVSREKAAFITRHLGTMSGPGGSRLSIG